MAIPRPPVFVAVLLIVAALTGAFVAVAFSSAPGLHLLARGPYHYSAPSNTFGPFAGLGAVGGSAQQASVLAGNVQRP